MAATKGKATAKITPEDLERLLSKAPAGPVYVLHGPEAVLRDAALRALKAKVVRPEYEAFNYRTAEPSGLDAVALAEEMRAFPMGEGGRLVVVSPAEGLLKDQIAALAEYASDPNPDTCLVLVAGEMKESLKKLAASAVTVDCGSPYEDHVPAHLVARAKELGVRLDRDAASAIASFCGRDLSRAMAELEKAAEAAGPGARIDRALIESLASGGEAADLFKISAALVRGDAAGAVHALRSFLAGSDRAELRVLFEMGMHLRKLLVARGNLDRGMRAAEAVRAAGVFWKDADAFAASLPRWSEDRIAAAYGKLLAADRAIKRGMQEPAAALEAYLWWAGSAPAGARERFR